jgi:GTPase
MFVDEVEIDVAAGDGGRGAMSFRREKFVPRGGPDGGAGGSGGSVYMVASPHVNTLVNYRFHPTHAAERGKGGSGANRTGANGKDLELEVPIGTLVYARRVEPEDAGADSRGPVVSSAALAAPSPRAADVTASNPRDVAGPNLRDVVGPLRDVVGPNFSSAKRPAVNSPDQDWQLIADLAEEGQRALIARGGIGGLGNAHFATSTNRAPRKWQPGLPGEVFKLRLHLKLLADVGLVGYPNAGKSTLISRISAARPKIANYPFTTLTPNLGVATMSGDRSFVVADVPGLIEGAHEGHGLGDRFLKHLERTKVLIHLVDVSGLSGRDPVADLDILRRELSLFDAELAAKPQIVAATKIDAVVDETLVGPLEARAHELGLPFFRISAVAGIGLDALLEAAWSEIAAARQPLPSASTTALPTSHST